MTFLLWEIVALAMAGAALMYFVFALGDPHAAPLMNERFAAALVICTVMVFAISLRDLNFGPDSQVYYGLFSTYCFGSVRGLGLDYQASFVALNIGMLGTCRPELVIVSWTTLFVIVFLALPLDWQSRIQLLALALVSMIGIELTTNILRQGLSAAFMLLGFAWLPRRMILSAAGFTAGLLLHPSAGLVLAAGAVAWLPWRYYLIGYISLVALATAFYFSFTGIEVFDRLFYEMTKYSEVEATEIYVRVLAVVQLCIVLALTLLSSRRNTPSGSGSASVPTMVVAPVVLPIMRGTRVRLFSVERLGPMFALRLALTALPFITIPFFGYRYIYGIYLIVLYSCYTAMRSDRAVRYEAAIAASAILALGWSLGSSMLLTTPFVAL